MVWQERLTHFLMIRSDRQVLVVCVWVTVLAVAVPVCVLGSVLWAIGLVQASPTIALMYLVPAALIPLLIAAPLSLFLASVLRLLTVTIERLDSHIRLDSLTGVLTRSYFMASLREASSAGGSFLMIDADKFKAINDTFGHDVGDAALKCLADVLMASLPKSALIGRLGGEEFGVFLPGQSQSSAAETAWVACSAVRERGRMIAGEAVQLTVSVGICEHNGGRLMEQTMKSADSALYLAKRSGRDRVVVSDPSPGYGSQKPDSSTTIDELAWPSTTVQ